ncbi:MAG: ABC transporter permease subunit [Proteobacteria bacterium]|jgi:ABC-2 type transport system permease protein|nr:ABC transporter permease subunit [Pseudomonadota bacterium]
MNLLYVARRDLAAYLHTWPGYLIIAGVLFVDGGIFTAWVMDGARYSHEVLEDFFYVSSGIVMIASVLLTMRTVAEERASGTLVLLRTSPVSDAQVIGGKYLASMGILAMLTLLTIHMPLMIFVHGKVAIAHIATGYLGLLALGSATVAIGIFSSSLFRSQMASAMLTAVVIVTLLTAWVMSNLTDPPFSEVLAYAALFDKHFMPFMEGMLTSTALVYYASITWVFLMLATRALEGRRWE